jgi:hypothetical protein
MTFTHCASRLTRRWNFSRTCETEGRAERKHAYQARAATYAWVPQITLTGPIGLYPGGVMKVAPLAIENPAGPFGPVIKLATP